MIPKVIEIRSISFDTSFLLKDTLKITSVIKQVARDQIPCFVTSTVISELEQLKIWGRITKTQHKQAIKRIKKVQAKIIDFKNRFLSNSFERSCMLSMQEKHGVQPDDIRNDCAILVTTLKKGVDVFLSEDFHFTSKITRDVIDYVSNAACTEYHQMCDTQLYSINADVFLAAYHKGTLDIDIIESRSQSIRKPGKRL